MTGRAKSAACVAVWVAILAAACWSQDSTPGPAMHGPAAGTGAASWSEFHRTNMERWNPNEHVLNVNNVAGLELKWSYSPSEDPFYARCSPAVVNGVVYFGAFYNLFALNASDGSELWRGGNEDYVSSPAVDGGLVYIGETDTSGDWVQALNTATGASIWEFGFSNPADGTSGITVANGIVYTSICCSYPEQGVLYALSAANGAVLWSFAAGYSMTSTPAVANGVVYVGSWDHYLYALNAKIGAKLWSYKTGNAVASSPAIANGVVYFGSDDGKVYALNAKTGKRLWAYKTGSFVASSPAVAKGVVYIGSDDHNLYALDAKTGAKLWSYKTGSFVASSPAVANGVVYVGSFDNKIYAFNASTGAKLWSYPTGGYIYSSPVVVNGMVYVGSADGYLYAFGLK